MFILIAGPYRSGTNDNPEKITANVHLMESFALPIFRMGHIPVLGEWFALPLVHLAGSKKIGDDPFNEYTDGSASAVCVFNSTIIVQNMTTLR